MNLGTAALFLVNSFTYKYCSYLAKTDLNFNTTSTSLLNANTCSSTTEIKVLYLAFFKLIFYIII